MISYVDGDATLPLGEDLKIIAHVCNDVGGWGRGFVKSISKKWSEPEEHYRDLFKKNKLVLGDTHLIYVTSTTWVCNMIAQHGYSTTQYRALDYDALKKCLCKLNSDARYINASVHMPKVGCGLGGGDWVIVEEMIRSELIDVNVFVYNYVSRKETHPTEI